jgi:hypothetical protein
MAKLITVDKPEQGAKWCKALESGNILFFPTCPFPFPQDELDFLLAQRQTGASNRKNIAYKPQSDRITNFVKSSQAQHDQLLEIMRRYSQRVTKLLTTLLPPYADKWQLDYASFRPFQERGRPLRTRARNDLLHVDSFPSRPMHGSRILRFFTNINPKESRHWMTTSCFSELAAEFGGSELLPFPKKASLGLHLLKWVKKLGLPLTLRSPYDTFMLSLHNHLKENTAFQRNCPKDYWEFPPNSCWAVFTDQVSHAATAGQYALEQTLIIPISALTDPQTAPLRVLEKLTGRPLLI